MKRQLLRSSSFASLSRGNHSKGADSVRPSSRWTTKASSLNSPLVARGSLATKVFVPPFEEVFGVLIGQLTDTSGLSPGEASCIDELHRRESELGIPISFFHMDMRRLCSFPTKEEEPEALDHQEPGHGVEAILLPPRIKSSFESYDNWLSCFQKLACDAGASPSDGLYPGLAVSRRRRPWCRCWWFRCGCDREAPGCGGRRLPFSSRCVAQAWRRPWGETRRPATRA